MTRRGIVLLVEDDENDATFFQLAVARKNLPWDVQTVSNGQEAIQYMSGEGNYADRQAFPFPNFIITDNRMPLLTGTGLLQWIKNHPSLRVIPTVVLGGPTAMERVDLAYSLGAHSYFVKPATTHALESLLEKIFAYWAEAVVPPSHHKLETTAEASAPA